MRSIMLAVVLLIVALGLPNLAQAQDRKFLTCQTLDQLAAKLDTITTPAQPLNEETSLEGNGCFYQSYTAPPFGPNYQVLVQLWYHVDSNGLFFEVEYVETQGNDGVNTPRFFRLITTRSVTEWNRPGIVVSGAIRRGSWLGALSLRGYAGPLPNVQGFVDTH